LVHDWTIFTKQDENNTIHRIEIFFNLNNNLVWLLLLLHSAGFATAGAIAAAATRARSQRWGQRA
jgi:hypothetical protein